MYLKSINDGLSVASKKSFDSSQVAGPALLKHTVVFKHLKTVKRPAKKKIIIYTCIYTYFFYALKIFILVFR